MADPSDRAAQACLLVYERGCRLCVTAKRGLGKAGAAGLHADATYRYGWFPYQSEGPSRLGRAIGPGRPNVAFMVSPKWRDCPLGSMHFWPSCQASRVGGSSRALEPSHWSGPLRAICCIGSSATRYRYSSLASSASAGILFGE